MQYPNPRDNWSKAKNWACYFHSLVMDFSWVARRVESVALESSASFCWNHQTSLDLDMDELRKRIQESGVTICGDKPVAIPVDTIRKGLILQFNVIDQRGNTKSLATSDVDSRIAQLALLGHIFTIDESLFNSVLLDADKPNHLSKIADEIYAVVHDMKIITVEDVLDRYGCTSPGWGLLFQHQSFRALLSRFLSNFPLIVHVNSAEEETIIKYQYIEVSKYEGKERIRGGTGTTLIFENPRIGEAQREHLHLDAPHGTEFSHTPILIDKTTPATDNNSGVDHPEFYAKTTPQRISFYSHAKIEDSDKYCILVGLRPEPTGFLSYALLGLSLGLIVTMVCLVWQITLRCSVDFSLGSFVSALLERACVGTNTMPVVTLIQLLTNVFLVQIFIHYHNNFRNRIMRRVLTPMIASMILSTLSCALLVAGFPTTPLIWLLICIVDIFGIAFVFNWIYSANKHRKIVMRNSNKTYRIKPIYQDQDGLI